MKFWNSFCSLVALTCFIFSPINSAVADEPATITEIFVNGQKIPYDPDLYAGLIEYYSRPQSGDWTPDQSSSSNGGNSNNTGDSGSADDSDSSRYGGKDIIEIVVVACPDGSTPTGYGTCIKINNMTSVGMSRRDFIRIFPPLIILKLVLEMIFDDDDDDDSGLFVLSTELETCATADSIDVDRIIQVGTLLDKLQLQSGIPDAAERFQLRVKFPNGIGVYNVTREPPFFFATEEIWFYATQTGVQACNSSA